ncbi:MAG: hypothetical protein RL328_488, partial [Acidobacteriota bacterium]
DVGRRAGLFDAVAREVLAHGDDQVFRIGHVLILPTRTVLVHDYCFALPFVAGAGMAGMVAVPSSLKV